MVRGRSPASPQTVVDAAVRRREGRTGLVVAAIAGRERAVAAVGRTRLPDGPRPGPNTLFEIGSVTKAFTGLLLGEAVVRGELALSTPVRDLLTDVVLPPGGRDITLDHLVTHTSGLPRWPPTIGGELATAEPFAAMDGRALLAALARTRLSALPGAAPVSYSNFGVGVLGHALVAAAGHDGYGSLVRDRVCGPLGLVDTLPEPDPEQTAREADGHDGNGRPVPHWPVAAMPASGALRSTATDLLAFLAAQLRPDDTPLASSIALTHRERRPGLGLGWWRDGPVDDIALDVLRSLQPHPRTSGKPPSGRWTS